MKRLSTLLLLALNALSGAAATPALIPQPRQVEWRAVSGWGLPLGGRQGDEHGAPIEVVDPLREDLMPRATRQRSDTLAFLANRELFGDLVDEPRFTDPYSRTLDALHAQGAARTLHDLVHSFGEQSESP